MSTFKVSAFCIIFSLYVYSDQADAPRLDSHYIKSQSKIPTYISPTRINVDVTLLGDIIKYHDSILSSVLGDQSHIYYYLSAIINKMRKLHSFMNKYFPLKDLNSKGVFLNNIAYILKNAVPRTKAKRDTQGEAAELFNLLVTYKGSKTDALNTELFYKISDIEQKSPQMQSKFYRQLFELISNSLTIDEVTTYKGRFLSTDGGIIAYKVTELKKVIEELFKKQFDYSFLEVSNSRSGNRGREDPNNPVVPLPQNQDPTQNAALLPPSQNNGGGAIPPAQANGLNPNNVGGPNPLPNLPIVQQGNGGSNGPPQGGDATANLGGGDTSQGGGAPLSQGGGAIGGGGGGVVEQSSQNPPTQSQNPLPSSGPSQTNAQNMDWQLSLHNSAGNFVSQFCATNDHPACKSKRPRAEDEDNPDLDLIIPTTQLLCSQNAIPINLYEIYNKLLSNIDEYDDTLNDLEKAVDFILSYMQILVISNDHLISKNLKIFKCLSGKNLMYSKRKSGIYSFAVKNWAYDLFVVVPFCYEKKCLVLQQPSFLTSDLALNSVAYDYSKSKNGEYFIFDFKNLNSCSVDKEKRCDYETLSYPPTLDLKDKQTFSCTIHNECAVYEGNSIKYLHYITRSDFEDKYDSAKQKVWSYYLNNSDSILMKVLIGLSTVTLSTVVTTLLYKATVYFIDLFKVRREQRLIIQRQHQLQQELLEMHPLNPDSSNAHPRT